MAKGTSKNRTKSGKPSAAARKKYGEKSGSKKGSFPIFDKHSADSALKLRGRRSGKAKSDIEERAAKFDPAAAKKARAADKKKGK